MVIIWLDGNGLIAEKNELIIVSAGGILDVLYSRDEGTD